MLLGVSKVRVGVEDQDRAKQFWVDTLGCDVVQDESYGDERWLEVRLPDGVVLVLERRAGPDETAPRARPTRRCSWRVTTWTPPGGTWWHAASCSRRSRWTCRSDGGPCSRTPRATDSR